MPSPESDARLLRRGDWRWLLPDPQPGRAVCFGADPLLARSVAGLAGCVVPAAGVEAASCDLAVAVDPSPAALRAAWRALAPGGACYVEWRRPRLGGVRRVRDQLRESGLRMLGCYWPWPGLQDGTVRVWLPLDGPGAQRYYLRTLPTPNRRLRKRLARLGWSVARAAQLVAPLCAVARKPAIGEQEGADALPGRVSTLLLTGGPRPSNKVVALVFAEPSPEPVLVVKLPRVAETVAALRREAAALRSLDEQTDVEGVPHVVFWQEHGGLAALGETVVSGAPLYAVVRRSNYRALALQATDWLIRLAGRPRREPRAAWWPRLVEPLLSDFARVCGPLVDCAAMDATRAYVEQLESLPLVVEQRDFWSGNVVRDAAGQLGVIDWEDAEPCGWPLFDLLHFLADFGFVLDDAYCEDNGGIDASYCASLDPRTLTGATRQACLERYARALGLDELEVSALRLLVWLPRATWDVQHNGPDSRFLRLWRHERQALGLGA